MTFSAFLKELKQKEIEISFSDGKIIYSGPEENITQALIGKLKEYKGDFIKYYWPDESKNMIPVNPRGSKAPYLFCECLDLSRLFSNTIGPEQPIYEFHNNTWTSGEKFAHKTMESLARDYINQLKKILPDGPYILGGHSFGGTLAYEMAIQLQKSGNQVPLVVLFDSLSPYFYDSFNWRNNLTNTFKIIYKMTGKRLMDILKMSFYKILIHFKKSLPKSYWRDYVITNYLILLYKYRPEKLNVNVLLFKACDGTTLYKYDNGWGSINSQVKIVKFEGDHLSIFKRIENIEIMGNEIEKYLADFRKIN